ncbi:MAG: glycosyltransferase family 2 protein [Geobacteraceae bacterium]|nr:glycosyltransferase family 2 protein [Geobacteraceae bacterium]
MDLTVIVCTYNRLESLKRLVAGFDACKQPGRITWELLIINNNSTDGTDGYLSELVESSRHLRSADEPLQGLSHSRNRGIMEAAGRFLFFMDDDAAPDGDFLCSIERALQSYVDARCFGVKVISHFPQKPDWFAIDGPFALTGILGIYDLGESDRILTSADPHPLGSGILIEKGLIGEVGCFDTNLGVKEGVKYPSRGEDTDLMDRLRTGGTAIYYLANTVVNHYPDLLRYNLSHLKKMYIGSGLGLARDHIDNCTRIFGVPRYLYKHTLGCLLRAVCWHMRGRGDAAVYYRTRYWLALGMIMWNLGLHREDE